MRNRLKTAARPLFVLVLGILVAQAPVASEGERKAASELVDFRMAPLEQVKKINTHLRERTDGADTLTIMTWDGQGEGEHIVLAGDRNIQTRVRALTAKRRFDSVSWSHRANRPYGTCDSQAECERKTDEMCDDAGHGGVNKPTVRVITHADGSKTCSGDCDANGAVAFVTCNPGK
jgi:hypothetical protein